MRDSLSIVDDILVKGEAIVIPSELRAFIKKRLHIHSMKNQIYVSVMTT